MRNVGCDMRCGALSHQHNVDGYLLTPDTVTCCRAAYGANCPGNTHSSAAVIVR
jgi:hypothetical protein